MAGERSFYELHKTVGKQVGKSLGHHSNDNREKQKRNVGDTGGKRFQGKKVYWLWYE